MNEQQLRAIASVLNYMDRAINDGVDFSGTVRAHGEDGKVKAGKIVWDDASEAHILASVE